MMILSAITKKECIMESYICGKTKISLIMRDDFETVPLRHGMYVDRSFQCFSQGSQWLSRALITVL